MRRRSFLAAASLAKGGLLAGCIAIDPGALSSDGDASPGRDDAPTTLGDVLALERTFAFDGLLDAEGEPLEVGGRYHRGDQYYRLSSPARTVELYLVEDTLVTVVDGTRAHEAIDATADDAPDGAVDPRLYTPSIGTSLDVPLAGRTSVDGTAVYTFAIERPDAAAPLTAHVDRATGHLVRIGFDRGVIDYADWGTAGPVEAPG